MDIKKISIFGFWFCVILGSLFHFVYEFFGKNIFLGYFVPVNESTFEHLKLVSTPVLLFAIFEYFLYGNNFNNFFIIKALGIIIGAISIIVLFYSYKGVIGRNFLVVDIGIFIVSIFLVFYFNYFAITKNILDLEIYKTIGIILMFLGLIASFIFTINPPKIPLFLDPVTKSYGIG